jgi:hypothetical protein
VTSVETFAGPAPVSERSRGVALALATVGGFFGLHRFYTGRTQSGILMLCTMGGAFVWYLYDIVVLAAGDFHDGEGRRVARWSVSDAVLGGGTADRRIADAEERLQSLESQVSELGERLDFAERLLAQARDKRSLP